MKEIIIPILIVASLLAAEIGWNKYRESKAASQEMMASPRGSYISG